MKVLRNTASGKLANLTIRIPTNLATELAELRKVARQAGLEFPASDICRDALVAAVRDAHKELARISPPSEPSPEPGEVGGAGV